MEKQPPRTHALLILLLIPPYKVTRKQKVKKEDGSHLDCITHGCMIYILLCIIIMTKLKSFDFFQMEFRKRRSTKASAPPPPAALAFLQSNVGGQSHSKAHRRTSQLRFTLLWVVLKRKPIVETNSLFYPFFEIYVFLHDNFNI